jgi:hypothetical protein
MARLEQVLTPSLYLMIRERLVSQLMGNLTPTQKQTVLDELAIAKVPEPAIPEFEPVE